MGGSFYEKILKNFQTALKEIKKPPIYITSKANNLLKPNVTEPEAAYELPGCYRNKKQAARMPRKIQGGIYYGSTTQHSGNELKQNAQHHNERSGKIH
jgi:hypothetical protein